MRRTLLAIAALSVVGGCGGGYEDENRSIMDEPPALQQATPVSVEYHSSCGGDTCLFGNDRSGALVVYEVDTSEVTVGFDNWEAGLVEFGVDARGAR